MNLLNLNLLEQGAITGTDGSNVNSTTRVRTAFIPVNPSSTYYVDFDSTVVRVKYVLFYNSSGTKLSHEDKSSETADFSIVAPSGSAYLRFAFQRVDGSADITPTQALNEGKVALSYVGSEDSDFYNQNKSNINTQGQFRSYCFVESRNSSKIAKTGFVEGEQLYEY